MQIGRSFPFYKQTSWSYFKVTTKKIKGKQYKLAINTTAVQFHFIYTHTQCTQLFSQMSDSKKIVILDLATPLSTCPFAESLN